MRSFLPAVLCVSLGFAILAAQQPAPNSGQPEVIFKAEVDYVDVDTIVTDRQGNFVGDLQKDDFELFEDGKPQKIDMFSYIDLPVVRPDRFVFGGRPAASDVKANQQSLAGRLYVIVLDDFGTSLFRTATVKRNARQFIERNFGANDVGAIVYTSGRTDASQEFTSDPALLLASVDKFVGRKLRSSTLDKIDSYWRQQELSAMAAAGQDPSSAAPPTNTGSQSSGSSLDPGINPYTRGDGYPDRTFDSEDMERGYRALRVLEQLRNLSEFMGNIHGRRKAMLLFSEGIDYPTTDIFGAQEATTVIRAMQDAVTAAARGNVSIFGIDPRGLVGMSADAFSLDSPGPSNNAPVAAANYAGFGAEMRLSQDSLRTLSEETGGFATVNTNNPTGAFDQIVRANSRYYVLAYYPPAHPRDGRFHKIEVRVKRPNLAVTARKGYASPRGKTPEERAADERLRMERDAKKGGADTTSAELRAVLNTPMQQAGVSMLVQASPFKALGREHSVALAVEIDGSGFQFERRNNGAVFADTLELSYFTLNEQGKPQRGERSELELNLRPDTYERARQTGFRINQRLALAPGRYQLRIGVRESGARAMGTVFYDLLVPDFGQEPLSMSGMLLTSATSPLVPTLIADKQIASDQLPGPPTSRRTFAQGDELGLYAEIYDNLGSQNHTVAITGRLVGEDGREVFSSRESRNEIARPKPGTSTFPIAKRISLKDVAPGRYLLQLEARVGGDSKDAKVASRESILTVIPAPR